MDCYTRGEQRRCTTHSTIRRFLEQTGWTLEGEKAPEAPKSKPLPEVAVDAGGDAFDFEAKVEEASESLDEMTKAELLDWAMDRGHDLKNALPKAEILKLCKKIETEG